MQERTITSRIDAIATRAEIARDGNSARIEPCDLPDMVVKLPHCRYLNNDGKAPCAYTETGNDGKVVRIGVIQQNGGVTCPIQRGELKVVQR